MISCRYLSILIMFFFFLANSAFGLGPYKDNGETILDQSTGLEWQKRDHTDYTDNLLTWEQALAYCEDLELAGYDDWRLPNKLELRSIVEHSKTDPPAINNLFYCQSSWFWSSTSIRLESLENEGSGAAWLIDFQNGVDVIAGKDLDYIVEGFCDGVPNLYCDYEFPESDNTYARCVRSRPVSPSTILSLFMAAIHRPIGKLPDTGQTKCYNNRREISCQEQGGEISFYGQDAHYQGKQPAYRKNKDLTITDLNTNLIWQQNSADVRTWQGAVEYCAGLTSADNSEWRLPAKHELQSIVDYGISEPDDVQPTINSIFSSLPSGYWSATPLASDTGRAWVIYFDNGNDYMGEKTDKHHIRCVQGKP